MPIWLIPISLFWILAAVYFGGFNISIVGGSGFRQVLGLLVTYLLFLVAWGLLRLALGHLGENFLLKGVAPTLITMLALPLVGRAGFGVLGVRIHRGGAAAH